MKAHLKPRFLPFTLHRIKGSRRPITHRTLIPLISLLVLILLIALLMLMIPIKVQGYATGKSITVNVPGDGSAPDG